MQALCHKINIVLGGSILILYRICQVIDVSTGNCDIARGAHIQITCRVDCDGCTNNGVGVDISTSYIAADTQTGTSYNSAAYTASGDGPAY